MKTKKVYLATPVGDPTEIDIRRKAEQAKKILESKDELRKMFSKEDIGQLEECLNYIETYNAKTQNALEQASKINVDWVSGRAKYDPNQNYGYNALQNAGVEGADAFLSSFVSG